MLFPSEGVLAPPVAPRIERRRRYRRPFHNLAYVKLDAENGGILRDISDQGAALQAVAPLEPGQHVDLHFDLLGPSPGAARRHMDVQATVAWVTPSGQAGVEFQNFRDPARRQLNEWILGSILTSVAHLSPVLSNAEPLLDENLRLAPAVRVPIALPVPEPRRKQSVSTDEDLLLDWLLHRVSPETLSLAVDGLVLGVAALLFLVVALAVTQTIPGWLSGIGIAACAVIFCGTFYWWMCRYLGMPTAGRWLAEHAVQVERSESRQETVRFR